MKAIYLFSFLLVASAGCSNNQTAADAFGNFEATEVLISSEASGKILSIEAEEGMKVSAGDLLCRIDTTMVSLQISELEASAKSVSTRIQTIDAQDKVLAEQIRNLHINIERTANMITDKAAPGKQLDDLNHQLSVLKLQKDANSVQKNVVRSEIEVLRAKKALLMEQLSRHSIHSPANGTILKRYIESGELTATGKPLFALSDMSEIKLKAYISGAQLSRVKPGDSVLVRTDRWPDGFLNLKGYVSNISEKSEFTPKIIQTREERVTLVYGITVIVKNDGAIKNGMPGEVIFLNAEEN